MASDTTFEANNTAVTNAMKGMSLSPKIALSDEQQSVLDMVKDGRNVFFTGSAGTCIAHTQQCSPVNPGSPSL